MGRSFLTKMRANPGSLSLTFVSLTSNGSINAKANMAGKKGGTLTISSKGLVLDVGDGGGNVDIRNYLNEGFDDVTLQSSYNIRFEGTMNATVGRKLTLDAQKILGSGQDIALSAPWIELTNTSSNSLPTFSPDNTGGLFTLVGDWIDLNGSVGIPLDNGKGHHKNPIAKLLGIGHVHHPWDLVAMVSDAGRPGSASSLPERMPDGLARQDHAPARPRSTSRPGRTSASRTR